MSIQTFIVTGLFCAGVLIGQIDNRTQYTSGIVLEKLDSGGYSYLQVESENKTVWLAAPLTGAQAGETVRYSPGMLMENFTSPSMKRTFPEIYFTGTILRGNQSPPPTGKTFDHSESQGSGPEPVTADKISRIQPLKDGFTIKAVQAQKKDLAGSKIMLRGVVTKYNADIMGKNWLHLRDASTGSQGHDLVVTTPESFTVGDVVVLEGTVALDQDFGFGYSYDLLLTEAKRVLRP